VAVVGGSGGIGGSIVRQLVVIGTSDIEKFDGYEQYVKQGVAEFDQVIVVDVVPPKFTHKKLTFRRCDITKLDQVTTSLEGCTHVIDTAGVIDLREHPIQLATSNNINVVGTFNVVQACLNLGIKVYYSLLPKSSLTHHSVFKLQEFGLHLYWSYCDGEKWTTAL